MNRRKFLGMAAAAPLVAPALAQTLVAAQMSEPPMFALIDLMPMRPWFLDAPICPIKTLSLTEIEKLWPFLTVGPAHAKASRASDLDNSERDAG